LVGSTLPRKEGLTKQHLCDHAPYRPHVNRCRIVSCSENQLRSSVVPRANICHVWLALNETLGGSEITNFESVISRVDKDVLRFDVAMADSNTYNGFR
jgi:hypothetical protein